MNLQPLEDRIVVRPTESDMTTASGLVIPDTAKEKPQEAEVVAVGPGRIEEGKHVSLEVKKGDKVLIGKYSGTEVKNAYTCARIRQIRMITVLIGKSVA